MNKAAKKSGVALVALRETGSVPNIEATAIGGATSSRPSAMGKA